MEDRWSDEELRGRLLAKDAQALEAVIARYAREVAYFVRMLLDHVGTAQDVEECVNDLFVTVWVDIASFDPTRGTLRTWLTMRAKYLTLDRRRQIQRRQTLATYISDESLEQLDERELHVGVSGRESLEGLLERREQHEQLRRALHMLPELDKVLVYLRYFRLASTEEIAAKTGLTRRAIDTRLWRARKGLREMLEALEERSHGHVRSS